MGLIALALTAWIIIACAGSANSSDKSSASAGRTVLSFVLFGVLFATVLRSLGGAVGFGTLMLDAGVASDMVMALTLMLAVLRLADSVVLGRVADAGRRGGAEEPPPEPPRQHGRLCRTEGPTRLQHMARRRDVQQTVRRPHHGVRAF